MKNRILKRIYSLIIQGNSVREIAGIMDLSLDLVALVFLHFQLGKKIEVELDGCGYEAFKELGSLNQDDVVEIALNWYFESMSSLNQAAE